MWEKTDCERLHGRKKNCKGFPCKDSPKIILNIPPSLRIPHLFSSIGLGVLFPVLEVTCSNFVVKKRNIRSANISPLVVLLVKKSLISLTHFSPNFQSFVSVPFRIM